MQSHDQREYLLLIVWRKNVGMHEWLLVFHEQPWLDLCFREEFPRSNPIVIHGERESLFQCKQAFLFSFFSLNKLILYFLCQVRNIQNNNEDEKRWNYQWTNPENYHRVYFVQPTNESFQVSFLLFSSLRYTYCSVHLYHTSTTFKDCFFY